MSFWESSDHASDCYDNFMDGMDSLYFLNINVRKATEMSTEDQSQSFNVIESLTMFISEMTSNYGAGFFGNCSITTTDIMRTGDHYLLMYSQFSEPNEFFTSLIISLMSNSRIYF